MDFAWLARLACIGLMPDVAGLAMKLKIDVSRAVAIGGAVSRSPNCATPLRLDIADTDAVWMEL
jgi:hypothetical protein